MQSCSNKLSTETVILTKHLNGPELRALLYDLLGVVVGGFVDLQQPGGLRHRLQSVYGLRALKLPLFQPFIQVTDVAPGQERKPLIRQPIACLHQPRKETGCRPDLHPFPARAHVFAEHDVVEGHGAHLVEHLLDHLVDEALVHAVLAHGGVDDAELLDDGGDGEALRVLVVLDAVGALPEACGLHAGDALQALVLQHAGNCVKGGTIQQSCR